MTYDILKSLNQKNYQTYNREVARTLGSHQAAIILQELIDRYTYHTEKHDHEPLIYKGVIWWYETIEKLEERTCIKRKGQDAAIKILEKNGLILKIQKGCPPKRYFYLHQENILKLYSGCAPASGKLNIELLICPNGTNQDVLIGQLEMSESDNLETPQVALEEKGDLHIKNLSNEPKKKLASTAAPIPSELKEEPIPSGYDANVNVKKLRLLDGINLTPEQKMGLARATYEELQKSVDIFNKRTGISNPYRWLWDCINKRYWEASTEPVKKEPPKEAHEHFEIVKTAYKASHEQKGAFDKVTVSEHEIRVQDGLRSYTLTIDDVSTEKKFINRMEILNSVTFFCGFIVIYDKLASENQPKITLRDIQI